MPIKDISGRTFGHLTAVAVSHRDKTRRETYWICHCVCGAETIASARGLQRGDNTSCGCNGRGRPKLCACGEHAFVATTLGMVAFVDAADCDIISGRTWTGKAISSSLGATTFYAVANVNGRQTYMHRLLMPDAAVIDHADRNGMNNRRGNIRAATHTLNLANTARRKSATSPYRGVSQVAGKWRARIMVDGKERHLGTYGTADVAAAAYNAAAKAIFGDFATTNSV